MMFGISMHYLAEKSKVQFNQFFGTSRNFRWSWCVLLVLGSLVLAASLCVANSFHPRSERKNDYIIITVHNILIVTVRAVIY